MQDDAAFGVYDFNSTLVRLKVLSEMPELPYFIFQFHFGTIKSS